MITHYHNTGVNIRKRLGDGLVQQCMPDNDIGASDQKDGVHVRSIIWGKINFEIASEYNTRTCYKCVPGWQDKIEAD